MTKQVTISKTFTRLQLVGIRPSTGKPHDYNEVNTANSLILKLLAAGVPVVGVLGIVTVEWGKLTITHDPDGLDGDEWTYTWTGDEVPKAWRPTLAAKGYRGRLDKPLREAIDDEL